ncbi:MAG: DUF3034 family protein [Pseudomonadota bacterium]
MRSDRVWWLFCLVTLALPGTALAGSKITATGGARNVEGSAGGGLVPWSLMAGYGSSGEWSASAFVTRVTVDDYQLDVFGVSTGWGDRVELSIARQTLDVEPLNTEVRQDVFGAKVRLFGELLYTAAPQVSLGFAHKRQRDFALPAALGARRDSGTDLYLSASKLWFAALADRNLYLNGTLRYTEANETGLLGFGGPDGNGSLVLEAAVGLFLTDRLMLGYEYRQKPDHLSTIRERDWQNLFLAWFPSHHLSLVAAYADLDEVANRPDQTGAYLSLQLDL